MVTHTVSYRDVQKHWPEAWNALIDTLEPHEGLGTFTTGGDLGTLYRELPEPQEGVLCWDPFRSGCWEDFDIDVYNHGGGLR